MNDASSLPRIIISVGEPAGIGPELVLALAQKELPIHLTCVADPKLLESVNKELAAGVKITTLESNAALPRHKAGILSVVPNGLHVPAVAGRLNPENAAYVLRCLDMAISACVDGRADALVTAPLQKSAINEAGYVFSGHTEYLAEKTAPGIQPIMLLAAANLRVALVTTHMPLRDVPAQIDEKKIQHAITVVNQAMQQQFAIKQPRIAVCGLNPHAGEHGHFGREEIDIIEPAIRAMRTLGIDVDGPLPGDTAFTPANRDTYDCFIAMFHDQGLPVIKALNFGEIVNVTLGLPIIRTSVDHGTGLDIAGQGTADPASLICAVQLAAHLATHKSTEQS